MATQNGVFSGSNRISKKNTVSYIIPTKHSQKINIKTLKKVNVFFNCQLDYWPGHGRTYRTVCYGPGDSTNTNYIQYSQYTCSRLTNLCACETFDKVVHGRLHHKPGVTAGFKHGSMSSYRGGCVGGTLGQGSTYHKVQFFTT